MFFCGTFLALNLVFLTLLSDKLFFPFHSFSAFTATPPIRPSWFWSHQNVTLFVDNFSLVLLLSRVLSPSFLAAKILISFSRQPVSRFRAHPSSLNMLVSLANDFKALLELSGPLGFQGRGPEHFAPFYPPFSTNVRHALLPQMFPPEP